MYTSSEEPLVVSKCVATGLESKVGLAASVDLIRYLSQFVSAIEWETAV